MVEKYYLPEEQREDINYLHRSQLFVTFSSLIFNLGDFEVVRIIKEEPGFSEGL